MTDIDVPDWVVEIATEAYSALPARTTFHDSMQAALRAALSAWVVPTAWCVLTPNSDVAYFDRKPMSHEAVTLYTLRQEKPE